MNAPVRSVLLACLPLALLAAAPEASEAPAPEAPAAAPAPSAKPFPHTLHVEEQEMPCKSCHDLTKAEGLPVLKTKGCGKCHDDGPPAYNGPTARRLGVKFPHAAHASKGECEECHKDVLAGTHLDTDPLVQPKRCFECHEEKNVPVALGSCARCHGEDKKRERPGDHDGSWRERHGDVSGRRVWEDHGKTCTDCHKPATCTTCHMTQEPRSHNGLWRVRTHGLNAGWDRDRCKTCHETGTCIRCHQDTKPINHAAGWITRHGLVAGARTNETCNVCHQAGWCAACHSGR